MRQEILEIIRVMGLIHGREISLYDESFLAKSIDNRLVEGGFKTAAAYVRNLSESSAEAATFIHS